MYAKMREKKGKKMSKRCMNCEFLEGGFIITTKGVNPTSNLITERVFVWLFDAEEIEK